MIFEDVAIRPDVTRVPELEDGSIVGRLEIVRAEELLDAIDN